jgi:PhnB protein
MSSNLDITPYLTFNGNCEEALNYYKDATGGTIGNIMTFDSAPDMKVPDNMKKKILHSMMTIGKSTIMASDTMPGQDINPGGPVSLSLNFDSIEEEEKVFNKLSAGGKVTMPLQDTFWGARFGMCTDKFGINWMFNCDKK